MPKLGIDSLSHWDYFSVLSCACGPLRSDGLTVFDPSVSYPRGSASFAPSKTRLGVSDDSICKCHFCCRYRICRRGGDEYEVWFFSTFHVDRSSMGQSSSRQSRRYRHKRPKGCHTAGRQEEE